MEKKFDISDAVSFGWQTFKDNIGFYILVVLILLAAAAVPSALSSIGGYTNSVAVAVTFGVIFGLISFVVGMFVNMAQVKVGLSACDQQPGNFEDLYSSYPRFLDFFLGGLLYFLIVMGGLILFIIPGIYWAVRYHFFGYLILDQGMSPVDAIKKSGQMTRGCWWQLFVFWLAVMGIWILGYCACCVGIFVAFPVIMIAIAYVYRSLLASTGTVGLQPPSEVAPAPPAIPPAAPPV